MVARLFAALPALVVAMVGVAVLILGLTLAAFYIAVPIIGPSTLIRLLKGRRAQSTSRGQMPD